MADEFGKLILRLGVGGLMLFHGIHTLLTGLDPVKAMLTHAGLPEALAYGVYFGEIVGPVLVIIGLFSRFGAVLMALEVILLVVLNGGTQVFALAPDGSYALELEALYFTAAVSVALLGAGRISLGRGGWS